MRTLVRVLAAMAVLLTAGVASAQTTLRVVTLSDLKIGWPCDEKIEKLCDDFARTNDPAKRKQIAEALQVRLSEFPTYAPLGQFNMPVAMRSNVSGNLEVPATVFWNVKKGP
jgi:ABC-type transport system substrate-binding protein